MSKKLLFSLCAVFLFAAHVSAQFVFVNSPASLEGSYEFDVAQFGADLASDVWTADAAFVDDGVDVGTDGCETLINGADLMGKIALIDRGSCEFGLKCLQAEQEGAIAAIVFNNNPGAGVEGMGAGANGGQVTIPCVMLTYEAGQAIRDELANGPVNITMGLLKFNNDLSIVRESVRYPLYGTVPAAQSEADQIPFNPSVDVSNIGFNEATNINVEVSIDYLAPGGVSGVNVYTESGSVALLEPDSSEFVELGEYIPAEGMGTYFISYTIESDSLDDVLENNMVTASFDLTDGQYAKSRWNFDENQPLSTTGTTPAAGGSFEFLTGFRVPDGNGLLLDTVVFQLSLNNPTTVGDLEEGSVTVLVYEWEDLSEDGTADSDEMEVVSYNIVEFEDPTQEDVWLRIPLLTFPDAEPGGIVIDGDDKIYFVGVRYEGTQTVFFGFDANFDQTIGTDMGFIDNDADLPYIGVDVFDGFEPDMSSAYLFLDNRSSLATGLVLGDAPSDSKEEAQISGLEMFPNPSSDVLKVELELLELQNELTYRIVDASGRQVASMVQEATGLYNQVTFDVSDLASGQYFLVVKTDQGIFSEAFNVQR